METFILQTYNGNISHDFVFQLDEAIRYQNWYAGKEAHKVIYVDSLEDLDVETDFREAVPVGSLEFVIGFVNKNFGFPKDCFIPLNIPRVLMVEKFLKRECQILFKNNIKIKEEMFIKSATKYKAFLDITSNIESLPEGKFLVSEKVDIESEWRGFVFRGQLVGIQNYSGSFEVFPDVSLIKEMIKGYKNAPNSYTIDVGVNDSGTFIIEAHPFVSCGLYGFHDNRILPQMFMEGYDYFVNSASNESLRQAFEAENE